jgi:hypothetical protein
MRKDIAGRRRAQCFEFAHDRHEVVTVGSQAVQDDHRGIGVRWVCSSMACRDSAFMRAFVEHFSDGRR